MEIDAPGQTSDVFQVVAEEAGDAGASTMQGLDFSTPAGVTYAGLISTIDLKQSLKIGTYSSATQPVCGGVILTYMTSTQAATYGASAADCSGDMGEGTWTLNLTSVSESAGDAAGSPFRNFVVHGTFDATMIGTGAAGTGTLHLSF